MRINVSELEMDLLKKIKSLFGKDSEVTLTITATGDRRTWRPETKKSYLTRLGRALKNLENDRSVGFTEAELDAVVLERLKG